MAKISQTTNMIPLIEDYYFSCDDNQYILYQCGKRNKIDIKTKKPLDEMIEFTDILGYYCDLVSLLKGCVKHCNRRIIQEGKVNTLKDCIKNINETYDKIERLTNGY